MDLLMALSADLNLGFRLAFSDEVGSPDEATGEWGGVVGQLLDRVRTQKL